MPNGRTWAPSEEKILLTNYNSKTIKELMVLLPRRNEEAINNKIKRLKAENRIVENKSEEVIKRAYEQRNKPLFTVDQTKA